MPRIDLIRVSRVFLRSAGAGLLTLGLVGVLSFCVNQSALQPHDPLFMQPLRNFFWIVGGMEFAVAVYCLLGKNIALRTGLVLWLALNLLVYRIGMNYSGVTGGLNGYTGNIYAAFGVNRSLANEFFEIAVVYLLFGCLLIMSWSWWNGRNERLHPSVKMFCWACGIHIKFPIQELGRIVSCPHCRANITLRKPDLLKMTCFFCQGHIEFPAHAIGKKIPCPHCNMDITLKEPA